MEFIPLERYSKKTKNKKSPVETVQNVKLQDNKSDEAVLKKKKTKLKPKPKGFEKKNVKNKYKETLESKQKEKALKKKKQKSKEKEEEEEEEEEETDNEEIQLDDSINEENEEVEEEEKGENDDEAAFKMKCKKLDEKKKNRLFIKLKKKIKSEAQIKELHPDIRGVIFPRKKNSRWCWAVFSSQEKAHAALKQMVKIKEILVSKPNLYERVYKKQTEKLKTVLRKKEAKKKLQNLWM